MFLIRLQFGAYLRVAVFIKEVKFFKKLAQTFTGCRLGSSNKAFLIAFFKSLA